LNEPSVKTSADAARRQAWFRDVEVPASDFAAVDRQAIVAARVSGTRRGALGPVTSE